MSDLSQQMADLSRKIADLETHLGEVAGKLAELHSVMAPFLARYQRYVLVYYDDLIQVQREIADCRAALGDRSAVAPGQAQSPLDRFLGQPSVEEQFARAWHGKRVAKLDSSTNQLPATPEIKQLYAQIVSHLHPELTDVVAERARRRNLISKVDEAYVRRDAISLRTMADVYQEHTNLPALVNDHVVRELNERIRALEMATGRIEGLYYDLRYGLAAKIKANAELLWAEEKRDLIAELSAELQGAIQQAQIELSALRARL